MRGFRFLEMRGGCGCARVYGFPIFILFFSLDDTNNNNKNWILDLIFILDFYLRTQYSSTYGRPITYLAT